MNFSSTSHNKPVKLVILDRDGVINVEIADCRVISVAQFTPIESSLIAIAKLKKAGYIVAVATNQSVISKKQTSEYNLHKIHNYLQQILMQQYAVQIDSIVFCPHLAEAQCNCRKPNPGMLIELAKKYRVDFSNVVVPFVGDSVTDVLAAVSVGALPVLVKTGKGITSALDPKIQEISNLLIFADLNEFVDYWLSIDVNTNI